MSLNILVIIYVFFAPRADLYPQRIPLSIDANEFLQKSKSFLGVNTDSMLYYAKKSYAHRNTVTLPTRDEIIVNYGLALVEIGDFKQSIDLIESHLNDLETSNISKTLSSAYSTLGNAYLRDNQLEKALDFYFLSFQIDERLGDIPEKAKSLANIALIQKRIGRYKEAKSSFLMAIKIFKSLEDDQMTLRLLVNLSGLFHEKYTEIHRLDSAEHYAREAYQLAENMEFPFGQAMSAINLSAAIITQNEEIKNEEALKEGLRVAQFAKTFFSTTNFEQSYHQALLNESLAQAYLQQWNDAETALHVLLKSPYVKKEAHNLAFLIWDHKGDYKKAIYHLQRHHAIKDSIENINRRSSLSELDARYQKEIQQARIAELNHEKELQDLQIAQKNTWIIVLIFGLIVLGFLTHLIVQRRDLLALKRHSELEHRFLRSQLNPHFIFNALSSVQTFMLKGSSKEAAILLAKFSKLMRQILEYSREEYISVAEEIEMLKNYLDLHLQGNSFQYSIKVADKISLDKTHIPPMLIQPFIENALKHGMPSEDKPGYIIIDVQFEGAQLAISVQDNGPGMYPLQTTNGHQSLGTSIIRERIEKFNKDLKEKITLSFQNISDHDNETNGTLVMLKVPIRTVS